MVATQQSFADYSKGLARHPPRSCQYIDSPFDFALIDANHTYDAVRRDIGGVLPYLADRAYLLFHDANYPDVKRAIDEAVAANFQLTIADCIRGTNRLQQKWETVTWAAYACCGFSAESQE